jgi:hypothetical protein
VSPVLALGELAAATAVLICWQAGQRICLPACSSAIRNVRPQFGQRISNAITSEFLGGDYSGAATWRV